MSLIGNKKKTAWSHLKDDITTNQGNIRWPNWGKIHIKIWEMLIKCKYINSRHLMLLKRPTCFHELNRFQSRVRFWTCQIMIWKFQFKNLMSIVDFLQMLAAMEFPSSIESSWHLTTIFQTGCRCWTKLWWYQDRLRQISYWQDWKTNMSLNRMWNVKSFLMRNLMTSL